MDLLQNVWSAREQTGKRAAWADLFGNKVPKQAPTLPRLRGTDMWTVVAGEIRLVRDSIPGPQIIITIIKKRKVKEREATGCPRSFGVLSIAAQHAKVNGGIEPVGCSIKVRKGLPSVGEEERITKNHVWSTEFLAGGASAR